MAGSTATTEGTTRNGTIAGTTIKSLSDGHCGQSLRHGAGIGRVVNVADPCMHHRSAARSTEVKIGKTS